jgi:pimeloyl-ACP methyl ester carboxylesterase
VIAGDVVLASGLRLSYADQGDPGDPTVVALPGPTDSWRSYRPVLERLPAGIRAVAVSLRGHGDSDKPAAGYRIDDFAVDVVQLLAALGIERALLTGHSGSCLVVRRVALDHPERVAGLVLEASPTTLRGNPDLTRFVTTTVAQMQDPVDTELARSLVTDTSSEALPPGLIDELVSEVRKVPARVWRATFQDLLTYDDLPELPRVTAPTLLVWGDQDGIVSRAMQERLLALLPASRLVVHAGAGHTPRWDDPARFASDLAAFVGDVSG